MINELNPEREVSIAFLLLLKTNQENLGGAKRRASPVAQLVKNPPSMWETQVQSLGWEDPQEKEMATHSRVPAWEAWRAAAQGVAKSWTG